MHVEQHLREVILERARAQEITYGQIETVSRARYGRRGGVTKGGIQRFVERGGRPTPKVVAAYAAALDVTEIALWREALDRFASQMDKPDGFATRALDLQDEAMLHRQRFHLDDSPNRD